VEIGMEHFPKETAKTYLYSITFTNSDSNLVYGNLAKVNKMML
jgi:hypothetical protein